MSLWFSPHVIHNCLLELYVSHERCGYHLLHVYFTNCLPHNIFNCNVTIRIKLCGFDLIGLYEWSVCSQLCGFDLQYMHFTDLLSELSFCERCGFDLQCPPELHVCMFPTRGSLWFSPHVNHQLRIWVVYVSHERHVFHLFYLCSTDSPTT